MFWLSSVHEAFKISKWLCVNKWSSYDVCCTVIVGFLLQSVMVLNLRDKTTMLNPSVIPQKTEVSNTQHTYSKVWYSV